MPNKSKLQSRKNLQCGQTIYIYSYLFFFFEDIDTDWILNDYEYEYNITKDEYLYEYNSDNKKITVIKNLLFFLNLNQYLVYTIYVRKRLFGSMGQALVIKPMRSNIHCISS